ncbi:hypothetical protein RKD52_001088 [Metabacillus sp. SLBN-84]
MIMAGLIAAQTLICEQGKVFLTGVSSTNVGWFMGESVLDRC